MFRLIGLSGSCTWTPGLNWPVATVLIINSLSPRQWQRQPSHVCVTDAQSLRLILYARLMNGQIYPSSISVKSVISLYTTFLLRELQLMPCPRQIPCRRMSKMSLSLLNVPFNRPRPHPQTYPRTAPAAFRRASTVESATVVVTWSRVHGVTSNSIRHAALLTAKRQSFLLAHLAVQCQTKFVNSLRPCQQYRGIYNN